MAASSAPTRASSSLRTVTAAGVCAAFALVSLAADVTVFGPETYTRRAGKQVTFTSTLRIDKSGTFILRVVNKGVRNARIAVNGQTVLGKYDFKGGKGNTEEKKAGKADKATEDRDDKDDDDDDDDGDNDRLGDKDEDRDDHRDFVPLLERPVTLRQGQNQITVRIRSRRGASFTVDIRRASGDTTPPTITATAVPPPNANGWNRTPVIVTFACADPGGSPVGGADAVVFGPRTYLRGSGKQVTDTRTFRAANPSDTFILRVVNNGVRNARIAVNGRTVLGKYDFRARKEPRDGSGDKKAGDASSEARKNPGDDRDDDDEDDEDNDRVGDRDADRDDKAFIALLERPLTLRDGQNEISVRIRSRRGTSLTVDIRRTNEASGLATCTGPVVVEGDGANQVVSGTATDTAGNRATTTVTLKIDKTSPIVTAVQTPAASADGWNNGPVVVTFAATDQLSGVAPGSVTAPRTLSTDGANQSAAGQAMDLAGNTGTITKTGINIDQAAPAVTVVLAPAANANGWNDAPVTVHFTCTDITSGVATCPADQIIATDGADHTVSGTATDRAGNATARTSPPVNLDQTPPTIAVTLNPVSATGLYHGPVTAHFTCADGGSGVATCPPDQVRAAAGSNQTVSGTATDAAGNTTVATSAPFTIQLDLPGITVTLTPPANANGWRNGPVTAHFTCLLSGAPLAGCPADRVITAEGPNQTVTGTVTDPGGGTASVTSEPFSIDVGVPLVSTTLTPAPNANGWNNAPVTVHFTCTDITSGVATCPADQIIATDGADHTVSGTATDRAGNATARTSPPVNLDQTPPTIAVTLNPVSATGLYHGPVTAHFTCADGGSGVATCPPDQVRAAAGSNQTVSGTATDAAGNTTVATSAPFTIQLDLPGITVTLTPPANANGWRNGPVTAHFTCLLSGAPLAGCPADRVITAEGPNQTVTGTVTDPGGGTASVTSEPFSIDVGVPLVSTTLTPAPNANGWNNAPVTAHFTCADPTSGVATCPADQIIATDGAAQSVSGEGTDRAGNGSTASATVSIDRGPPVVKLDSPVSGTIFSVPTATVTGTIADALSGVAGATCNGAPASVNGASLSCGVTLTAGANLVTVALMDRAGNASTASINLTYIVPSAVTITSLPVLVASEGQPYSYLVQASPADGRTFQFSLDQAPGGMTIAANGAIAWTPGSSHVGPQPVTVRVVDGNGGTATQVFAVTVSAANHPPLARPGGPYTGFTMVSVSFDGAASTDPDGEVLTYAWSFGDGASATGPAPSHTYATADQYTIALTVTDARGGLHRATTTATIAQTNRPPTASAGGPYAGDAGSPLALAGAGADPDGDTLMFEWTYGDGTPADIGAAATHVFAAPGTFTLTLTVTDGRGGRSTATTTAVVGAMADRVPPAVRLSAPKTALPGTQAMVTASAVDNVGVAAVTFEVGGAASSQVASPPYQRGVDVPPLAVPGTIITVKATARDAAGNAGIDQALITIVAAPDTTPPMVAIQLPLQASPGSTLRLSANATDDVGVQTVAFSTAGVTFATLAGGPFTTAFVVPPDTAVGSTLTFTARAADFSNNAGTSTGTVAIVATPDTQVPTVTLTVPETLVEGRTLSVTATATDDVRVASVDFVLDGVVVGTAIAAPYQIDLMPGRSAGAVLRVRAVARDSSDNQAFSERLTRVIVAPTGAPAVITGEVYDDATGLPLAGATIALAGLDAGGRAYTGSTTSDSRGQYVLGAAGGQATVQVSRAGWTRVDRTIVVPDASGVQPVDARLTPVGAAQNVSAIGGGTVESGFASLTLSAGALTADAQIQVTAIGAQGVEGLLPIGWSPVAAVDVMPHGVAFGSPQVLTAPHRLPAGARAPLVVAMWDEEAAAWRSVGSATIDSDTATVTGAIRATGQYAWLLADTLPDAPGTPVEGDLVGAVVGAEVPSPVATDITPQPRILFYKPGVNALVGTVLHSALPSGTLLRARIAETYQFTSDAENRPGAFVEDLVLYQAPGAPSTVSAGFTVTPSLTFDPIDLRRGVISVEVMAPSGNDLLAMIGPDGGTVTAASGESLALPAGAFDTNAPVEIGGLSAEQLGVTLPPSLSLVGAVGVGFGGGAASASGVLSIPKPATVDETAQILLLRVVEIQGVTRLLLVGRGRVVGTRVVSERSVDPSAPLLDGVSAPGRYAFVRGTSGIGFATGTVFGTTGFPLTGALVTTSGLPIVALSNATGRYAAAATVGASTLTAQDLPRRDAVAVPLSIANLAAVLAIDLHLAADVLTVTSLTPAEGTTSTSLSTAIVVTFSAPIDPATLASGLVLRTAGGAVVAGAIALAGGNTRATFRPTSLLAANTSYTATVATSVTDASGRALAGPAVTHFTSLDTLAPPIPAAGSISATPPDASGQTTVRGTPGTAGPHDTVSIVNVTTKTFFPALVAANGSFAATFAAALADRLQVAITDQAGNLTVVAVPPFTRTNADGSMATVVGHEGGRVPGPAGIAVDVPADALPDGTVLTITSIDEASFPTQLTAEQKQFFGFAGGLALDFGGATPSKYLNVSMPATGTETFTDRWIVGQVVMDGGQAALNVVDTARLIGDRITTSSPPCPGVQAAATFGFMKPLVDRVGVLWGRFPSGGTAMNMRFSQVLLGAGAANVALPFILQASPVVQEVCIPALAGKVTVSPNSQKLVIPAHTFTPLDRQIVVHNQRLSREFYYPHNVADYRFQVDGTGKDTFKVTVVGTTEQPAVFSILPATTPGYVNIALDITTLNSVVSAVKIQNLTSQTAPRVFNQSDAAVQLVVNGGKDDGYDVTVVDANGARRTVTATMMSPTGAGNLLARAPIATIDPGTEVFLDQYDTRVPGHAVVTHERQIPAEQIQFGGFEYSFAGDESETFALRVVYPEGSGRVTDRIAIPNVVITVSDAVTGRVLSTLSALVPPPDEPYPLGKIAGDRRPPGILSAPAPLTGFDPTRPLTFTLSEGVTRESVEDPDNVTLVDDAGVRIAGTVRLSNQNKTLTFVPAAPLHLKTNYTLTFTNIRDASDNLMGQADFRISTIGPVLSSAGGSLDLLEQLTIVRKTLPGGAIQTLGFGMTSAIGIGGKYSTIVILDLTSPTQPVVLNTIPADSGRLTVLQNLVNLETGRAPVDYPPQDDVIACGRNAGTKRFTGDLLVVAAYTPGGSSALRLYDITDPLAPTCLVGSKLLTVSRDHVGVFDGYIVRADGAVRADLSIARTIVTLKSGARWKAYAAIEKVGLMMLDIGYNIPSTSHTNLAPEPYAPGSYVDVVAANGRLLAIDSDSGRLDIFDASLAKLSSLEMPVAPIFGLAYGEALPIDVNQDGQIGQDEVRDLAFVGGTGGVAIVDVTNPGATAVLGQVPINAQIFSLAFDAAKRRLFAGGRAPANTGEYTVFLIDLSGADPFTPVDKTGDPEDDRISWRSPLGSYDVGFSDRRSLGFDSEIRTLFMGKAHGYDTLRLDANLMGVATYTFFRLQHEGVDYVSGALDLPIRGAVVELRRPGVTGRPLQSTNTDETGFYSFYGAPAGEPLEVVVKAALGPYGRETARVADNTNGNKVYDMSSGPFTLGPTGNQTHDILAKTVWNAATKRYGLRDGAPFAILDDVYQAQTTVRALDPGIVWAPKKDDADGNPIFTGVTMAWSSKNSPSGDKVAKAKGLLGSGAHYFHPEHTVYLSGKENNDTDEYDVQVVLHEWSHYFMGTFSRDDSIAGTHSNFVLTVLDPRVSFSEGFATAFGAMMTGDPIYADTSGPAQANVSGLHLERDRNPYSSFYSEDAVQELLWDLFDGTGTEIDRETGHSGGFFDAIELGLKPIYDAMVNGVRNTPGFTTIFPFLADVMKPYLSDPLLKTQVGDSIIELAKGENIFLDHADQFDQSTQTIIPLPNGFAPIKIGRLYTPVVPDYSFIGTFGPETPYDGQPLETNTRFDQNPPDGNLLEEVVFFKFEVPQNDPPGDNTRHKFLATVTSADGGLLEVLVNQGGNPDRPMVGVVAATPSITACLDPGTHVVAVRAYNLNLAGDKFVQVPFPVTRRFTIQIAPTAANNGRPLEKCTVPTP
ncbi:MAG: PKD domain-containing protein [Vicinamibacterales bacterium]